jgi:hypothetical protein
MEKEQMDEKQLLEFAKNQLDRILFIFPRADAKASVVLGVDVGMLAILAVNAPPVKFFSWYLLWSLVPVGLLLISLWHLYQGAFPRVEGGHQSLIFFRAIAERTEQKFIDEFLSQKDEELIKDILAQIWRNSEILKMKYDHLKMAFYMLAFSILPWLAMLAVFTITNTESTRLLAK